MTESVLALASDDLEVEALIVDDCSRDEWFEIPVVAGESLVVFASPSVL